MCERDALLVWGSAFAACVVQSSLICQFESSGKVLPGLVKIWLIIHCYQVRPHFLSAALMSPQRTKQFCPHIEYFVPALVTVENCCSLV